MKPKVKLVKVRLADSKYPYTFDAEWKGCVLNAAMYLTGACEGDFEVIFPHNPAQAHKRVWHYLASEVEVLCQT